MNNKSEQRLSDEEKDLTPVTASLLSLQPFTKEEMRFLFSCMGRLAPGHNETSDLVDMYLPIPTMTPNILNEPLYGVALTGKSSLTQLLQNSHSTASRPGSHVSSREFDDSFDAMQKKKIQEMEEAES